MPRKPCVYAKGAKSEPALNFAVKFRKMPWKRQNGIVPKT